MNEPVEICGMEVCAGDIIHMDENGAVKFPARYLEQVNQLCQKLSAYEERKMKMLASTSDPEELAKIISDVYK